jgi:formate hydrogenlyase transcriptional activator
MLRLASQLTAPLQARGEMTLFLAHSGPGPTNQLRVPALNPRGVGCVPLGQRQIAVVSLASDGIDSFRKTPDVIGLTTEWSRASVMTPESMGSDSVEVAALAAFIDGISQAAAGDFFPAVVHKLTQALKVREAAVSEVIAPHRVKTLACCSDGRLLDSVEHTVLGTPCETVLKGEFCHHTHGLAERYPGMNAIESYIGMPLKARDGSVVGCICASDPAPMSLMPAQILLFKAFAASAAAELLRLHLERDAYATEACFRDLFDEAPIAYVQEDLETHFLHANKAAIRILGLRPEEVHGFKGASLARNTSDAKHRVEDALASIAAGNEANSVELELQRKDDGKPIYIQWWSRPDRSGRYTRTMFIDITERVLLEREQARLRAENLYLQEEIKAVHNFEEITGGTDGLLRVLDGVQRVARTDTTALIYGETGTGKELIARAIHSRSRRADKPFIKVNCAALPAALVESELFGHERGAFSGAIQRRVGRFELAHHGTIFLDEIGEMPLDVQVKLLRVLQQQEFERVGSSQTIKVDVRVIAATNRDLGRSIREGTFRQDLYYRLSVFPITVPPLRERVKDIPLLVKYFAQKYGPKVGRRIESIDAESMQRLVQYPWPGNIRELENLIERALILTDSNVLQIGSDILGPPASAMHALPPPRISPPPILESAPPPPEASPLDENSLAAVQRSHILRVLDATDWVIEGEHGAAARLGMKPATLRFRMKKFDISRPHKRKW